MHGNVYEYCQDWYDSEYYNSGSMSDPVGPFSGTHRVIRGGSWSHIALVSRSAFRAMQSPEDTKNYSGFRLVRLP